MLYFSTAMNTSFLVGDGALFFWGFVTLICVVAASTTAAINSWLLWLIWKELRRKRCPEKTDTPTTKTPSSPPKFGGEGQFMP